MAVLTVIGNKLVGVNSLDSAYIERRADVDDYLNSEMLDTGFQLSITGGLTLDYVDLLRGREAATGVIEFQPIGLGKPLTVLLRTIYVGSYPDTMRFLPGDNLGDILVTSAHKPFENFEAAPRAIHALARRSPRCVQLEQSAAEEGSRLLYYSPAVTDSNVLFTVELSVDREFSSELAEGLSKALSTAGALPVFASAAPFLVAAGVAIPIAKKATDMLASPKPYYAETVNVNFALAGIEAAQARALVLYPGDDEDQFVGYELGKDDLLRDTAGEPYAGDLPYAVLSLDGTPHADLETWTAQAASAVILERFFSPDERLTKALEMTTEALTFYNDVRYQARAAETAKDAQTAVGAEKLKLEKLAEAYRKNIQNEDIRKSVTPATAG